MSVFAIDPGVKVLGVTEFRKIQERWILVDALMIRANSLERMVFLSRDTFRHLSYEVGRKVILEKPVIYDRRQWKGDPNDLLSVAIAGGAAAAAINGTLKLVTPQRWKGGVPKKIHQLRIMEELSPDEREIVLATGPKSLIHNVKDAAGIGLWAVGRGV